MTPPQQHCLALQAIAQTNLQDNYIFGSLPASSAVCCPASGVRWQLVALRRRISSSQFPNVFISCADGRDRDDGQARAAAGLLVRHLGRTLSSMGNLLRVDNDLEFWASPS